MTQKSCQAKQAAFLELAAGGIRFMNASFAFHTVQTHPHPTGKGRTKWSTTAALTRLAWTTATTTRRRQTSCRPHAPPPHPRPSLLPLSPSAPPPRPPRPRPRVKKATDSSSSTGDRLSTNGSKRWRTSAFTSPRHRESRPACSTAPSRPPTSPWA